MMYVLLSIFALGGLCSGVSTWVFWAKERKSPKKSDHYVDYLNGQVVLRVFRYEYEGYALKGVPISNILESGRMNDLYKWVMFEKYKGYGNSRT